MLTLLVLACQNPDAPLPTSPGQPSALEVELAALTERLDALEAQVGPLSLATSSFEIEVPGDAATVSEALDSLGTVRFAPGVVATILLTDPTYVYDAPIVVDHPEGEFIHIVGASSSTVLEFPSSEAIVVVGGRLGLLDNLTLRGNPTLPRFTYIGVRIDAGGEIRLGPDLVVEQFSGNGVLSRAGSVVVANGVTSRDNVSHGFESHRGGVLIADGAAALGNGGSGFRATFGGTIFAPNSTASDNAEDGYSALNSSAVGARDATARNNGRHGGLSIAASAVDLERAVVRDSGDHGLFAGQAANVSVIDGDVATSGGVDLAASRQAHMTATGAQFDTSQPEVEVVGSRNSMITQ